MTSNVPAAAPEITRGKGTCAAVLRAGGGGGGRGCGRGGGGHY